MNFGVGIVKLGYGRLWRGPNVFKIEISGIKSVRPIYEGLNMKSGKIGGTKNVFCPKLNMRR